MQRLLYLGFTDLQQHGFIYTAGRVGSTGLNKAQSGSVRRTINKAATHEHLLHIL